MRYGLLIALVIFGFGTSCDDVVVAVSCEAGSCTDGEGTDPPAEILETIETETTEITATTETTETTETETSEIIITDDGPADPCAGKPDGAVCESDSSACTIDRCVGEVCIHTPRLDGELDEDADLISATYLHSGEIALYTGLDNGEVDTEAVILLNQAGVPQWVQPVELGDGGNGQAILQVGSFLVVGGKTDIRPGLTSLTQSGDLGSVAMLNGSGWGDASIRRPITPLGQDGRLLAYVSDPVAGLKEAVTFRFEGPGETHIEPILRESVGTESLVLRGDWATSGDTHYLAGWAPQVDPGASADPVGAILRYRPETINYVLYLQPEIDDVLKFRLFDVEALEGGHLAVLGYYIEQRPDDSYWYHFVVRRITADGATVWESRVTKPQMEDGVQWLSSQLFDLVRTEDGTLIGVGSSYTSAGEVPIAYAWDESDGTELWNRDDFGFGDTHVQRAFPTPENGVLLIGTHVQWETEADPETGATTDYRYPRVFWTFLDSAGDLCNP